MFLLDSAVLSGVRWALKTLVAAAQAEQDDDSGLRAALLDVEMRAEAGEITQEERAELEGELLASIHEIKQRRAQAHGPIDFAAEDGGFEVDANVAGDFHEPAVSRGRGR
ncbi:gas vesicle protein GvpG [Usitatibacter palustris]|uniref:Gas vesicle protein GvpG n=1 Tax=Usitatibacter palustris TaxID=2732487 RepID=A0A6M4H9Q8_9PROT|nr:gas vesicle protein GvpG [Usitatibacter palustris]QJR16281.1 hypothetical protein DSM104440_03110 [Usitatibacter palustris]